MSTPRFEGSYLGSAVKIDDRTVLECKICWYCYDPEKGDDARQIRSGTPFSALPPDWRCPQCDGDREQFMVIASPDHGTPDHTPPDRGIDDWQETLRKLLAEKPAQLADAFRHIHNTKMRDTPFSNRSLSVEAVGFRIWEERLVGILLVPWFMNIIILPGPEEDWSGIRVGEKRLFPFPSGAYEFLYNDRPPAGSYFSCSLFSGMGEFSSQLQATEVARAAIAGLFDPANQDETDHAADIVALRQAELEAEQAGKMVEGDTAGDQGAPGLNRRALLTGGLATATPERVP